MATTVPEHELDELRRGFEGAVLTPESPVYEDARTIFNAMITKRPAVIAQCASVSDVQRSVRFAKQTNLEVAVRSGGHSVAGASLSDGGLVIDMRRMNVVTVDPGARTATVAGGATIADLDQATQQHGLATTGGRVSTTGVGGFTLGGGSGWIERKFGFACDRLLAVDLVTATGDTVRATETEHPELFWALHGGGGNFGVATSFEFRLDPLTEFSVAFLVWPEDRGPEVLRHYRDLMASAPVETGGGMIYLTAAPEMPFVPEALHGQLACAVLVTYLGDEAGIRKQIRPLLDLHPAGQMVANLPYVQLQSMLDDPPGFRNYWSAEHLDSLPDAAIEAFCARAADMVVPSPSQHGIIPLGGAVTRTANAWPMPSCAASWVVHPLGMWSDPADDQRAVAWARGLRAAVEPWSTGAVYLNFVGDEGTDRVVASFGRENYDRLTKIKSAYDPGNLFRLNHNIAPARGR